MINKKTYSILDKFLDITILKIDGDGNILEEVLNTKYMFKPLKVDNIYDIFSKRDRIRAERLIKLGLDEKKKFMEISPKFGIREYADVEVHAVDGEIYVGIKFFDSNRDREVANDRRMEEFASMAEVDPLTGLLNRYGYWERVKSILRCGDDERKLGILLVDIDNLKHINDSMGHKAGDKAIEQISDLISQSIRKRDVAVRYGGDEFVIVVEELSGKKSTAQGLAQRLIRTIRENKGKYLTTVSIGVHIVKVGDFICCLNNENKLRKAWDSAVVIADEMAYKAKGAGKNRLVCSF